MDLLPLTNPIQHYAWGSPTAIPELLGRHDLEGRPCAELWMGAHPKAPSAVDSDSRSAASGGVGKRDLLSLIEEDPTRVLGADVAARFGGRLPFLFKVLAAERALSIQAHPRKDQAEEGFAREDAAGIPRDAANRNYRDDNHKPELICALSEFWALRGFRPIPEIVEEFRGIAGLRDAAADLGRDPTADGLSRFFRTLMSLPDAERAETVRAAVDLAQRKAAETGAPPRYGWTTTLFEQYGEDIGVLASLYLNCIRLEPGQGLFLPAQTLHAYLSGTGVEIMANSDNVLRGGLTSKHIDVQELLSSLEFSDDAPVVLQPEPTEASCLRRFDTPAAEFELSRVELGEGESCVLPGVASPRILLCVEGTLSATVVRRGAADASAAGDAAGAAGRSLRRGDSVFAAAGLGEIRMEGAGVVYVAGVPPRPEPTPGGAADGAADGGISPS
jgi:mannose-6-phosphate isomerase